MSQSFTPHTDELLNRIAMLEAKVEREIEAQQVLVEKLKAAEHAINKARDILMFFDGR